MFCNLTLLLYILHAGQEGAEKQTKKYKTNACRRGLGLTSEEVTKKVAEEVAELH